uniref:Uncharacterized protein n=1 Tax=Panagrolaimus superbus TaxID=310955 RepID=A0A914XY55_9BILA
MEPAIPAQELPINSLWLIKKNDLSKLKRGKLWSDKFDVPCLSGIKYDFGLFIVDKKYQIIFRLDKGKAEFVEANFSLAVNSANFTMSSRNLFDQSNGYKASEYFGRVEEILDDNNLFFVNGKMALRVSAVIALWISPVHFSQHPVNIEYKVEKCRLETLLFTEFYECDRINIAGISLFVRIYPDGDSSHTRGKTCIVVGAICENETKFDARLKLSIDSANYSTTFSKIFRDGGYGRVISCAKDEFFGIQNKFFDQQLTLKISGTLIKERPKAKFSKFKVKELDFPPEYYHQYHHQKLNIRVGNDAIPVLKRKWAALTNSFTNGNINELYINDFDIETVQAAIQLINGSSIPKTFCLEKTLYLYYFCIKYNLSIIQHELSSYIVKSLSPSNVCCILVLPQV